MCSFKSRHTWYDVVKYAFYVNPKLSCCVFVLRSIHILLLQPMASYLYFFATDSGKKPEILYSCLMVAEWRGLILVMVMRKVSMIGMGLSWRKKFEKNIWEWIVNNSKMLQMWLHSVNENKMSNMQPIQTHGGMWSATLT